MQHEQTLPVVLRPGLLQLHEAETYSPVAVGVFVGQAAGDDVYLALRLRDGHAGRQSPDHAPVSLAPLGDERIILPHRQPDLDVLPKLKPGGHDADHLRRDTVDAQRPADDIRRTSHAALPIAVAEDRHRRGGRQLIGATEATTHRRPDRKRREELAAYYQGRDALRLLDARDGDGARKPGVGGQLIERSGQVPVVPVIAGRDPRSVPTLEGRARGDQTVGLRVRERADERRVYDAEHGDVCADSNRQDQDGDDREPRCLEQRAAAVSDILPDAGHELCLLWHGTADSPLYQAYAVPKDCARGCGDLRTICE